MELSEEREQEGIDRMLLETIWAFRAEHPVPHEAQGRLIQRKLLYYGREVVRLPGVSFLAQTVSRSSKPPDRRRPLIKTRPPIWAALFCVIN